MAFEYGSSHLPGRRLQTDRPMSPVVPHKNHQFFVRWERIGNPAAEQWEQWFRQTGTPYYRVEEGGRFMLYVHILREHRGWCCPIDGEPER